VTLHHVRSHRQCWVLCWRQVHESGEGRGSTDVRVKHVVEPAGNHVIRFCCALWVFNCTGLPIALQQVMLCFVAN